MVVVLNSGSSSLKVSLFEDGKLVQHLLYENITSHQESLEDFLKKIAVTKIEVVIHRVVHGGEEFFEPTKIDALSLKKLKTLNHLAPLHNPANLLAIEYFFEHYPTMMQYVVFDTAFFHHLPDVTKYYAIDKTLAKRHHIRRYGFHGSSHAYLSQEAQKLLGKTPDLITLHLGGGCSICAINQGKAVDISMGFTPLEGLMMGSRSGDVDAGVVLYLQRECGMDVDEVEHFLNKECGLFGVCGEREFVTILEQQEQNKEYKLAYEMFVYRIIKYIGSYFAIMPRCDALVFSGGIGEHSSKLRADVLQRLEHFGIAYDKQKNLQNEIDISSTKSHIKVFVIPTDEEKYMYESVMKKEKDGYRV